VTLFYADRSVNEFTAVLEIRHDGEIIGLEEKPPLKRTFTRPADLEEDEEEWLAMSHLKFRDLTFTDNARLRASLKLDSEVIECSFQMKTPEPYDETESIDGDSGTREIKAETP
jgi:hypothetical protein